MKSISGRSLISAKTSDILCLNSLKDLVHQAKMDWQKSKPLKN